MHMSSFCCLPYDRFRASSSASSPHSAIYCFLFQFTVLYTGCNRRKGPDFGRVFLMLNYTDITQNSYIQS